MRARLFSLGISGLLLASLLAVAPAADAESYRYRFDHRPDGLPATEEPAQTLVSAAADIRTATDSTLDAGVVLGAEPTVATDALLRLALGEVRDGTCHETWAVEVSTFEPTGIASRTGTTISLEADDVQDVRAGVWCGSVSVLSADGSRTVLDRLEEPSEDEMVVDDTGGAGTVLKVRNQRVEPGRWATLWMLVDYEGDDAQGYSVYGRPDRDDIGFVEAKSSQFRSELVWGSRTWVPVQVRLTGKKPRRIELYARPYVAGWSSSVTKVVTIRPTR